MIMPVGAQSVCLPSPSLQGLVLPGQGALPCRGAGILPLTSREHGQPHSLELILILFI